MAKVKYGGVVPEEALRFIRGRLKDLKPSFTWESVYGAEHAVSGAVAGVVKEDLLKDILGSIETAIAEGTPFAAWKKALQPTLVKKGWWGWTEVVDETPGSPTYGEVRRVNVTPRRLKLIYESNVRTAYAAGQFERAEAVKDTLPYLKYSLGPSIDHRPEHVAWDGVILPVGDPWWNSHMPPNGWGCKCRVRSVTRYEAAKTGGPTDPAQVPDFGMAEYRNKVTGQTHQVPKGIDPGWETNPGKVRKAAT
jgi:uncharacterized protein with gpF-like domain